MVEAGLPGTAGAAALQRSRSGHHGRERADKITTSSAEKLPGSE